ncbi:hypothetical protein VTJ49DRAFT_6632 [Mycothermus thermophilus]|uniref:Carboxylic ester hydrolase n=1 Tax=Humicola insolens TaxID=85995 RepID=A0ABR3V146_HUMIN
MLFSTLASSLLALVSFADATPLVKRATLTRVNNFGNNPSGARMYIYVPDRLQSRPPVLTAIHYCTGTANAFYTGTPYARLADQHGFIVVYPESPNSGGCWDVSSRAAYTRDSGSNSHAISLMTRWALEQYNGDPERVFLAGTSSGAMMTNVMAAVYPDLYKAGAAYAGVPAGCFYTGTVAGWNNTCANGQSITTQEHWARTALDMYPGYTGSRPRMLIYHGSADTTIYPRNFNETLKQWAGVFGYTYGQPEQTLPNNPSAPYTRYVYGPNLHGIYGSGVTHNIAVNGANDMEWFGITGNPPPTTTSTTAAPTSTSTTSTSTSTSTTSTSTTSSAASTPTLPTNPGCTPVGKWGQCGGMYYTGCTVCEAGSTCRFQNDWYSQCL